jgi:hypothetical protein
MGKYVYVSGSNAPREWITCKACGEDSLVVAHGTGICINCVPRGSGRWKGDAVGYHGAHARLYATRGKAGSCVWGCEAAEYEWANLTGNYVDPEDFASMCVSCHQRFDGAVLKTAREGQACRRGHSRGQHGYSYTYPNGKEHRRCRLCEEVHAKARKEKRP